MKDGFKVFDSDMHVLEPVDLWERYIDPAFKDRAPRGSTHTPMDVGVWVDVFSTDYPHYDTKYPEATAHFLELGLDDPSKRKILWDNCARLYGFPPN